MKIKRYGPMGGNHGEGINLGASYDDWIPMVIGYDLDGRNRGVVGIPEGDVPHTLLCYPYLRGNHWYLIFDFPSQSHHEDWYVWIMLVRRELVDDQVGKSRWTR